MKRKGSYSLVIGAMAIVAIVFAINLARIPAADMKSDIIQQAITTNSFRLQNSYFVAEQSFTEAVADSVYDEVYPINPGAPCQINSADFQNTLQEKADLYFSKASEKIKPCSIEVEIINFQAGKVEAATIITCQTGNVNIYNVFYYRKNYSATEISGPACEITVTDEASGIRWTQNTPA